MQLLIAMQVIFCTGYHREVPFTINGKEFSFPDTPLLDWTFNPSYRNMAFSLFMKTVGPQFPLAWMQARWVALVLSGQKELPPAADMLKNSQLLSKHHGIGGLDPFDTCDKFMMNIGFPRPTNFQLLCSAFTRPTWLWNYLMGPRWRIWVPMDSLCPPINKFPGTSMQQVGSKMTTLIGSTTYKKIEA